jgi:hypothetical protein
MFFLFCAFGCDLRLLVIQLTITASLISFLGTISYNDTFTTIIMPVTTRSQVKLLTGSTTELSQPILTSSPKLLNYSSRRSVSPQQSSQFSSPVIFSVSSASSSSSSSTKHYYLGEEDSDVSIIQYNIFQISKSSEISKNYFDNSPCSLSMALVENVDITKLFAALSSQITAQNYSIQEHIKQNDLKITTEFHAVLQANEDFKNDVHSELEDICRLLKHQVTTGSTPTITSAPITSSTTNPVISDSASVMPDLSSTMISNVPQFNSISPTNDVQTQMMLMLTETFSKLSTALVDKTSDMKSDWPKFSGDSKKFRACYLAIMAQVSLPPWQELYDPTMNDVVSTTSNAMLNGKLYAKLLVSLEGSALQSIVSRKHITANGILLLQELTQTYKPKNIPEVVAAKTSEFWGTTKRLSTETVDDYYNHFHELLDEINDNEETISTKSAMRHFIFTLGSEFDTIQNNFRIGNLPPH